MQEHFYNDGGRQYMILGDDDYNENCGYEMRMLFRNHLDTFLPVKEHFTNGNVAYEYDVTGFTSLEEYGRRKGLGSKEIAILLRGIENLRNVVAEYMLDVSRVKLDMRYIYINGRDVKFVYHPEGGKDFFVQLKATWENILAVLDHSDKSLVMRAYGVYQDILTGTFDPGKYDDSQVSEAPVEYSSEAISREEVIEEVEVENKKLKDILKLVEYLSIFAGICCVLMAGVVPYWISVLVGMISILTIVGVQLILQGKIKEIPITKVVEKADYISYKVDSKEIEQENNRYTKVLSLDSIASNKNTLLTLVSKDSGRQIRVEKMPAIIGAMSDCNVVLSGDGISRIHASINQMDGGFVIEDMNSTNGTWINGKRLESGKRTKLENMDILRFAMWEYEVRC